MSVEWAEPPPAHNTRAEPVWVTRLSPLVDEPKRWAIVSRHPSANAARTTKTQLQAGRYRVPPGRWEFTTRTTDEGGVLFARYLGPEGEA